MTYPVKWFSSDMQGAPALTGQNGKLIAVMDACLLNGFGSLTLDSLVVSGGIATAAKSTGHAYKALSVIEIAGASPSGLNGEKRILSVTATEFAFDATGLSDQTASGTITAKVPAIGSWAKAFSGTNKAVYRSGDTAGTRLYYRFRDDGSASGSGARVCIVRGYEAMTTVDSGSRPFPTTAQSADANCVWAKSETLDATAAKWALIGDSRTIYLFVAPGPYYPNSYCFHRLGDINPFKSPDPWAAVLNYISQPSVTLWGASSGITYYRYDYGYGRDTFPRNYAATIGAIGAGIMQPSAFADGVAIGAGVFVSPNPVDGKEWWAPGTPILDVNYSNYTAPRGMMRGMYERLCTGNAENSQPAWFAEVIVDGLPKLLAFPYWGGDASQWYTLGFDYEGPW
jgi:hypothetical protein